MYVLKTFLTLAVALTARESAATEFCPDNCKCDLVNKHVDCRNAGLTRIPWELPDPANLRQLDLSGNNIHEVLLETVSYQNLELLDLSNNRIVNIDDGVMGSLPHLKSLYLQNNDLSDLTADTLKGLKSLKILDLSENEIKVVKDNVFSDLESLEELNLAGNGIRQIREDTFDGLLGLRILNMGDNRLGDIPVKALQKVPQLTKLYFHENVFSSLPMHSFKLQRNLREINLQENLIEEIHENAFYDHKGSDTPSLEIINLSGNQLKKVPSKALSGLRSLVSVDLSKNMFQVIDPDSFKGLDRIKKISLSSLPELKVIRKYAFSELDNLQSLEIHSNRALVEIEDGAFLATPALRKLDLHANQLKTMSPTLLDWETLQEIDLRYNPWECDCHLQWLPKQLAARDESSSQYLVTGVRCDRPEAVAGHHIHDMSPAQMVCPETESEFEEHILIAITASISLVLLGVMLYLWKRGYCNLTKKKPRSANYYVHRHCNGHSPACHDINEEQVHIADNEQIPAGNNMA